MIQRQENEQFSIQSLKAKNAFLESNLAEKIATISKHDSIVSEKDSLIYNKYAVIKDKDVAISVLTSDLEAMRFQVEQLRRMIFGSKRERFLSTINSQQLTLEFEPKMAEIDETVKAERELIRVAYLRQKTKKNTLAAWLYQHIYML